LRKESAARSLGPAKRGEGETKNPLVRSPDEADASTGGLVRAMRGGLADEEQKCDGDDGLVGNSSGEG